ENAVRLDGADDAADGGRVLQLAVDDRHSSALDEAPQARLIGDALALVEHVELIAVAQILQVVELAAPAKRAEDFDIRGVIGEIFGQEATSHTGDAGDQDAHVISFKPIGPMSSRSFNIEPKADGYESGSASTPTFQAKWCAMEYADA